MSDLEIIAGLLLAIMLTLILGVLILSRNLHILGRKSALDTTSENYSLLKINNFPEIIVGAGTVLTRPQVKEAKQSGALFGLAPGFDIEIIPEADKFNFPFIPGIATPSEIQSALKYNLNLLKFFPAEFLGGIDYLKSISAPFIQENLKFIPLGGIDFDSAENYLNSRLILAIGGSWIANNHLIENCDWKEIENRANLVCQLIRKTKEN